MSVYKTSIQKTMQIGNKKLEIFGLTKRYRLKKVINLKVWIDDTIVHHPKTGQKATLSSMNKLYDIPPHSKKENFI